MRPSRPKVVWLKTFEISAVFSFMSIHCSQMPFQFESIYFITAGVSAMWPL